MGSDPIFADDQAVLDVVAYINTLPHK